MSKPKRKRKLNPRQRRFAVAYGQNNPTGWFYAVNRTAQRRRQLIDRLRRNTQSYENLARKWEQPQE